MLFENKFSSFLLSNQLEFNEIDNKITIKFLYGLVSLVIIHSIIILGILVEKTNN